MSILDGMMSSEQDIQQVAKIAAQLIGPTLAQIPQTEHTKAMAGLLQEGMSLADIMGITKEHRDALLLQGLRLLQMGEIDKAREVLIGLYQLEPLDERVIYAIAATYQTEGDVAIAGKLYVQFLALDATNPEGYLRLGECFLANGEHNNARSCFEIAKAEAERGNGRPRHHAEAMKMLDIVAGATNY